MNKAEIKTLTDRGAIVITRGAYSVLVAVHDKTCMVVSLTFEDRPGTQHIPYVYQGRSSKDAYETYLHLIGKMCLKDEASKYFGTPIWDEHCKNGVPGSLSQEAWELLAVDSITKVEKEESLL